ncbi:unnamed protein product [Blepharisma stoltei]|uniref:Uncharacterized protein n=1 Tax=Blepharisma stoltei TaxID=1481888 RepID=A0AAU9J4N4_9CILI|nr:unnamed protein product [Blepharisma stoltei]
MNPTDDIGNRILRLVFNQTNSNLVAGTSKGFRIVRLEDCKITSRRDKESELHFPGGFTCLAPMFSTQLICLVGSRENPRYHPNVVYFWDEYQVDMKGEIRFRSEVKNVLIRRDKVVIILQNMTYVYELNNLKPVASISTIDNTNGVGSISYDKDRFVLGTLDTKPGWIRIENFSGGGFKTASIHENPIAILSIDFSGTYGATASEQGTIIRVFDCITLDILHELRRGSSAAKISALVFSPDHSFLISSSNRATIHAWNIKNFQSVSVSGAISKLLPTYFQYQRSFAKLNLPPEVAWTCPTTIDEGPKACFANETDFFVAHLDGNLYKCQINETQNTITVLDTKPFLNFNETIVEGERQWTSFE